MRALVITPDSRILLFLGELPGRKPWWFTPGGGVERGETAEQALIRELDEETGLQLTSSQLGLPVWKRDYLFEWNDISERHKELFFVVNADTDDVSVSGWTDEEKRVVREYRWWTIGEIAESNEEFSPRNFANLLKPILAGNLPSTLISVNG